MSGYEEWRKFHGLRKFWFLKKSNETIFEEVKEKLDYFKGDPNVTYVAIYVSPISKDSKEHPQHNAYYKIKELLLNKEITSQVIYKEHIDKPDFYYFLPNIYVALLAKMGGIPWRLNRTNNKELIANYSRRMESSSTRSRFRFVNLYLLPSQGFKVKYPKII